MALITAGGLQTVIRRAGVERVLRAVDFPVGDSDPVIVSRVEAALPADLGAAVFIHIYSRSPVAFSIRVAPVGHVPPANWWTWGPRL